MKRFEGKSVLVTGGNSGIGLATAVAFAGEGAHVVLTGRDQSSLDRAASQMGERVIPVRSDAGNVAEGIRLAGLLEKRGVMLDAMFVNAGIAKLEPFETVKEDSWDVTFNTNLKGPYFLIQALLPRLNQGAAIVLNGSINAHIGMANTSVYAASKAALISLAKTLSAELLSKGVRVNVVSPGPVRTHLLDRMGLATEHLSQVEAGIRAQIPLKRFGTPDEIASAVLYLASPESAYIVGSELVADGGMSQL